jgi:hypothetical protein
MSEEPRKASLDMTSGTEQPGQESQQDSQNNTTRMDNHDGQSGRHFIMLCEET